MKRWALSACLLLCAVALRWTQHDALDAVNTEFAQQLWDGSALLATLAHMTLAGLLPDLLVCGAVVLAGPGLRETARRLVLPSPEACAVWAWLACSLMRWLVLHNEPMMADEWAYWFHARVLSAGHWVAPVPPCALALSQADLICGPLGWASQYPPGWPLLLGVATAMGLENWLSPALYALLVWSVGRWTAGQQGRAAGACASWLCLIFPCLLFNGASVMPHVPVLLGAVLCMWALDRQRPLLCGLAFGWLVQARYPEAATLLAWMAVGQKRQAVRFWLQFTGVALVASLPLLLQDQALTGSPWVTGYMVQGVGLHESAWQRLQMAAWAWCRALGWAPAAIWLGMRGPLPRWLLLWTALHSVAFARPGQAEFGARYLLLPCLLWIVWAAPRLSAWGGWGRRSAVVFSCYFLAAVAPTLLLRIADSYGREHGVRAWFTQGFGSHALLLLHEDPTGRRFYGSVRNQPDLSGTVTALFLEPEENARLLQAYPGREVFVVDWSPQQGSFVAQPWEAPRDPELDLHCAASNLANLGERERAVAAWLRIAPDSPARPTALLNAARVLHAAGQVERARTLLDQVPPELAEPWRLRWNLPRVQRASHE